MKNPQAVWLVVAIVAVFAIYTLIRRQKNLAALQTGEVDSKLFGNADGGTDIVGPVGMGLQGDLALKDRDQSFHLPIILGLLGNVLPQGW